MNYDVADRAVRDMNKRNIRAFDRLKTLKFDELNVLLSAVTKVYDDSARLARKRYLEIALAAYIEAMLLADVKRSKAEEEADDTITEDWILDMLEDYDEVTLYRFDTETERKKQRTVEAIVAAHNKNEAIDKELRYWAAQIAQYADNSVVRATIQGYKDAGVERVMWVSERDNRVCRECNARDGKIYDIDAIPQIPAHIRCRCILRPVK